MDCLIDYCTDKKVYIYGAGYKGRLVALYLLEKGCDIGSFIVSNIPNGNTKYVLDTPVVSIEAIGDRLEKNNVAVVIATGDAYKKEIICNLEKNGITNYYVIRDETVKIISNEIRFCRDYHFENNINILLYHRVASLPIDPRHLSISPECFEMHLKFIKKNYRVIRTDEKWDGREQSIVITFDDGHFDFFENVVPLLEKYEIPATVFVTTGIIDKNAELWGDELERIIYLNYYEKDEFRIWDGTYGVGNENDRFSTMMSIRNYLKNMPSHERERHLIELKNILKPMSDARSTHRIMTTEEIKKCAQSPYVTIGAHTVTHCCLAQESLEEQINEIKRSKEKLEEIIGKEVTVFAYPYGEEEDFTERTVKIACDIGFKKIFSVLQGMTSSKYINGRIPRNNVSFCKSEEELNKRLDFITNIYGNDYV